MSSNELQSENPKNSDNTISSDHRVVVSLMDKGYTTNVFARNHSFIADEPISLGGNDLGASPYELVSSGLGACTAITLRMYADRKSWNLQQVIVQVDHEKVTVESETGSTVQVDRFTRKIELIGELDEKQRQRLLQIANKCPVHKTLESSSIIETTEKLN